MRPRAAALAMAAFLSGAVAPASTAAEPSARLLLRAGTEVPLATTVEISSQTHRQGDRFDLTVSQDVAVDGQVVIPRAARAVGEVAEHADRRSFGKPGALKVRLLYVEVGGRRIRLDGSSDAKGKSAVGVGIAAGVVVGGLLGSAVKGKNATIPAGTAFTGQTHRDILLAAPPPPELTASK